MNQQLFLQILKTRRRSFILIAILFFLNIILYVVSSAYLSPKLTLLQNTWFSTREKASSIKAVDASTIYSQGIKDLQTWNSRILPKKDFARMLGDLFEMAGNNHMLVKSVTYKPTEVKNQGLIAYTIDFSLSGNYAGAKSLISDLLRSKQIIIIDDLQMANTSTTKEALELKLKLITYLRTEGQ